jgi:hypothetical protein
MEAEMVVSGSSYPMAKFLFFLYSGTRHVKHGFLMRDTKGEEVPERAVAWLSMMEHLRAAPP